MFLLSYCEYFFLTENTWCMVLSCALIISLAQLFPRAKYLQPYEQDAGDEAILITNKR